LIHPEGGSGAGKIIFPILFTTNQGGTFIRENLWTHVHENNTSAISGIGVSG
jgi:hypothetical protein